MTKSFDMIMTGLDDVSAFMRGKRDGFAVHIPEQVDVKAIREKLNLSQPKFAETFGFSVGRVRDWEQGRFAIDAPSRVFLTVIDREPQAVLRALVSKPPKVQARPARTANPARSKKSA